PQLDVRDRGNGDLEILEGDNIVAGILLRDYTDYRVSESFYCPEFGLKLNNQCIEIIISNPLPVDTGYAIRIPA
ncbi:MAG: hypothetical protein MI673_03480, partial [Thiotrichales bacterium]|nr:hypothetical protein [Thiotrichales bacterium]